MDTPQEERTPSGEQLAWYVQQEKQFATEDQRGVQPRDDGAAFLDFARWLLRQYGTAATETAVGTAVWLTRLRGAEDRTEQARQWLDGAVAEGAAQRVT